MMEYNSKMTEENRIEEDINERIEVGDGRITVPVYRSF